MNFNTRQGDVWSEGTPKIRKGNQWVPITERATGNGGASGGGGTGYSWDQTHTDTSWLFEADANDDLEVIKVTNLNASGPGSLASAVDQTNDPSIVVFEVGGVIDNEGTTFLRTRDDNLFIAGQTAPWPGITLINGGFRMHGDNTIIQHVSCMTGDDVDDPTKARAFTFNQDTQDQLVDHCTAAWTPDTNVNFRNNATGHSFINGINTEPLNISSHSQGDTGHGYNWLQRQNNTKCCVLGCINTHGWRRNPYSSFEENEILWANVYTYNWGHRHCHGTWGEKTEIDWIGNVAHVGPDWEGRNVFGHDGIVYMGDGSNGPPGNNVIIGDADWVDSDADHDFVSSPQNLPSGLSEEDIVPPEELKDFLVAVAGPRPADRAPEEQRMVQDFIDKEGRIINSFDDHPDMPTYTATSRTLNVPNENVLDWLQHYTDEVELGVENPFH